MKNRDRFEEAFGHMEHEVMGRGLEKFTLRHRFWLEALECPLVCGGEARMMDMEMAARVCAMPYEHLERHLPRVLSRGPRWWEKLGYLWKIWRRSAELEYRKFQAYMIDFGCPPATWGEEEFQEGESEDDGGDGGALPGVFGLVSGLMRGTGWEPDVVWSLSPGEAEWYLAGVFMHRGVDVGIKSGADEEQEEFLRSRTKGANPELSQPQAEEDDEQD